MIVTVFKNVFSKEPFYYPINKALERIKIGKSKELILEVRNALDKNKANKLKANLPSVCFSGVFGPDRTDDQLKQHSGFLVLDFDDVEDIRSKQEELINHKFTYACWISPSGKGLKVLVKIADGSKHREHFQALQEIFPEIDKSGINISRVCYESYDPDIYINENAEVYKKFKKVEKNVVRDIVNIDYSESFRNILKWLTNKNDAFVTGERNLYIFKLSSACCRFGIDENSALSLISSEYTVSNDFTMTEMKNAIKSAYIRNSKLYGSASFDKERLVDKITRGEINVKEEFKNEDEEYYRVEDVIYGIDVKEKALLINERGFEKVNGIGCPEIDYLFKPKRGEPTLLTGIGNYGKSAWNKWYLLCRILLYGEKLATFSPEDTPAEEYFHDFVEMLLGCECTPYNPNKPHTKVYEAAYDFISKYLFYINSEMLLPTPEYIKQKFLELIVQEKVDYCVIDPFNQMTNDYKGFGGRTDKYLETLLSDLTRFYQKNDVYGWIVAHPHSMKKVGSGTMQGNYECPDIFDINDGAMWNNKMYNILVYHRPFAQTQPQNPAAEFYSKKIKKKTVGKKGFTEMSYIWDERRFTVNGVDMIDRILRKKNLNFWEYHVAKEQSIDFSQFAPLFDENKIDECPF